MCFRIQILLDFAKVVMWCNDTTELTHSAASRRPQGQQPKSEGPRMDHSLPQGITSLQQSLPQSTRGPEARLSPQEGQLTCKDRRFTSGGYRNCSGLMKPHVLQRLVSRKNAVDIAARVQGPHKKSPHSGRPQTMESLPAVFPSPDATYHSGSFVP